MRLTFLGRSASTIAAILALLTIAYVLSDGGLNIRQAMNRSHQKRTMADIRSIATALESYATDTNSYSILPAPRACILSRANSFDRLQRVSTVDLMRVLTPKYIKRFPMADGWGEPFDIRIGNYDGQGRARTYSIRSMGSDRRVDSVPYKLGTITKLSEDIVFTDGNFFRYPEGS